VAVDVPLSAPRLRGQAHRAYARVVSLRPAVALAGLVLLSFTLRTLLAWAHETPIYLPDEYIYSELARSLAAGGRPLVRGEAVHFPALLEPLLAAPAWLPGDTALAYRLTQALHALAMSLAAVPVFLLARRLDLERWLCLAGAALTLAFPVLLYTAYVVADPIAYPLVLAAVLAGVAALAGPNRRTEALFLALSGLAAFARIQFVVLPVVFVAAALLVERGSIRRACSTARLSLLALGGAAAVAAALGSETVLGYYASVADLRLDPARLAAALEANSVGLLYATGWVLVPGAVVGLTAALIRPRSRTESAFAAITVLLAAALLAQAALYAANGDIRFKERYLMTLLPLVAPAFGLSLSRAGAAGRAGALVAGGLVCLALRAPLASLATTDGKQDSPLLFAAFQLEHAVGQARGSLLLALAAAALAAVAAGAALRPRVLAPAAAALAGVTLAVASTGAIAYDRSTASRTRLTYLPAQRDWLDHARIGGIALLVTPGSPRDAGFEQLFWNRSVDDVLYLPGSRAIDVFRSDALEIRSDGALLARGRPVRRPLVVTTYRSTVTFANARRLVHGLTSDLWRPQEEARLSTLTIGRWFDGWLERAGAIEVWPAGGTQQRLLLRLSLPAGAPPTMLRLRTANLSRRIVVHAGHPQIVRVPIPTQAVLHLAFDAPRPLALPDGRIVAVRADEPAVERVRPIASGGQTRQAEGGSPDALSSLVRGAAEPFRLPTSKG
jgi:hypothetical protein